MRIVPRRIAYRLLAALFPVALAACNGLSQVGNLPQASVTAVAATIGQPYTTDSSGVMHTTVRSGADVVLTGVNSETKPDDTGVPIISWKWSQVSPGSNPVDLIKRTTEASSFTAPQVSQPTTLTFQLTVANANGASASTQAQVMVEPAPDADHFLTFLNVHDRFTVTAITSAAVGATSGAAYNATLPFTITVTKLVTYTDNSGIQHLQVPVGQPTTYSGGWLQALGSGATSCSDQRNPQFQVPIPSLNLDDLLADGSGKRLSDVMQASDIDVDPANSSIPPAIVYAQVQITSGALPSGVSAGVCVAGTSSFPNTAAPNTLISDQATLTATVNPGGGLFDTSDSAHVYYSTIDPNGTRSTLQSWLTANGFNPSAPDWGADAHAVYTNNFDLGLGRDMYLKANCASGTPSLAQMTPQQLYQAIGQCDVASVVVNYVGVQAAAQHLNSIVAVAMEYSAVTPGGPRFTKFYAFAPDTRTGQLVRVTSVDLDHRGQKYLPQACVVCHGGTPGTVSGAAGSQQYTRATQVANGDVSAGFLPWDLASLLYSDTDPGFSQKSEDASLRGQYTEANQLSQFHLLNAGAYLTAADPNRFALLRELLEGWYGGQGLPGYSGTASNFNANFVPAGWQTATASSSSNPNGNPAGSDTFYVNVFSKTCRSCHVMQVPAVSNGQTDNLSDGGGQGSGQAACASNAPAYNLGVTDQFPIGCYWQFAKMPNLAMYLSDARMPFARRTMDRLWVDSSGYPSAAGQQLVGTLSQAGVGVVAAGTTTLVANPGFLSFQTPSGFTAGGVLNDVTDWVALTPTDPSLAELIAQPAWQVCADPGTGAPTSESCAGSSAQFPVVGASTFSAQFQIPQSGNFLLELDSGTSKALTAPLSVMTQAPTVQIAKLPTTMLSAEPLTIDLAAPGVVSPGNGPVSSYSWWVSNLTNLTVAPQGTKNCQSQTEACSVTTPVTLTLSPSSASSAAYTVNVADLNTPAGVNAGSASVSVTQLPANPQSGFVCAHDYLFASAGGVQAVLGGTGTCPTSSSSTGALDLRQGFATPAGYTLQLQLQCAPSASAASSCSSTQWVPGTLTVSNTTLQYTPPLAYATHSKTGGSGTSPVSLNYELVLLDSGNNIAAMTAWIPLTIQVRANVSFSSDVVTGVFQSNSVPQAATYGKCTSCHTGSVDGLDFSLTATQIYSQLCGGGSGSACNAASSYTGLAGDRYVNTTSVLSSLVLTHPADLDNYNPPTGHGGGNRCPGGFTGSTPANVSAPTTCDLNNVLLWIEDGANNF